MLKLDIWQLFLRNVSELLSKKQLISNDIVLDDERIYFGSNNPKLVIIAVTNPLCGFCAESFQTYL